MDLARISGTLAIALAWGAAAWFTANARVPFTVLGREASSRLAAVAFPRYYAWQAAASAAGAGLLGLAGRLPAALAAAASAALALAAWGVVLPRMQRVAREDPKWGRMHALSVLANLAGLVASFAALVLALV